MIISFAPRRSKTTRKWTARFKMVMFLSRRMSWQLLISLTRDPICALPHYALSWRALPSKSRCRMAAFATSRRRMRMMSLMRKTTRATLVLALDWRAPTT